MFSHQELDLQLETLIQPKHHTFRHWHTAVISNNLPGRQSGTKASYSQLQTSKLGHSSLPHAQRLHDYVTISEAFSQRFRRFQRFHGTQLWAAKVYRGRGSSDCQGWSHNRSLSANSLFFFFFALKWDEWVGLHFHFFHPFLLVLHSGPYRLFLHAWGWRGWGRTGCPGQSPDVRIGQIY